MTQGFGKTPLKSQKNCQSSLLKSATNCELLHQQLAEHLAELANFGEIESIEGQEVRFLVPREKLTPTISRILAQLPIQDLSVSEIRLLKKLLVVYFKQDKHLRLL